MAPNKKKNRRKKPTLSSTATTTVTGGSSANGLQAGGCSSPYLHLEGPYHANPYQYDGPRNAFEAKTVKEGFYVRMDMPGVGEDHVELKWESKKLRIRGVAPKESEYESSARYYQCDLDFTSVPEEIDKVDVKVKNGVFRMVMFGSGFQPEYFAASSHYPGIVPWLPYKDSKNGDIGELFGDPFAVLHNIFLLNPPEEFCGGYPFQAGGAAGTYEAQPVGNADFFLRIDMPDVGKGELSVKFTDKFAIYGGDGVKVSEHDEGRRRYYGKFTMNCPCLCKITSLKGEIKEGVLRMLFSKEKI